MTAPSDSESSPARRFSRRLVDPFERFDARVLDPSTAVRGGRGGQLRTTVYRNNRLLVTAADEGQLRQILNAIDKVRDGMVGSETNATGRHGPFRRTDPTPLDPTGREKSRGSGELDDSTEPDTEWLRQQDRLERVIAFNADPDNAERRLPLTAVVPLTAMEVDGMPAPPVDVVELVQRLRSHPDTAELGKRVGLEHLVFVTRNANLSPFGAGLSPFGAGLSPFGAGLSPFGAGLSPFGAGLSPFGAGLSGVQSYAQPGFGGRTPVRVVLPPPPGSGTGPVVVVLDTGCDQHHSWFPAQQVVRRVEVKDGKGGTTTIGIDVDLPGSRDSDPEGDGGAPDEMTGGIPGCAGHGTFITGILRQTAPTAQIVSLRICDADGVVPEGELAGVLTELAIKHAAGHWIDALVLSLGYYLEDDADPAGADAREHSAIGTLLAGLAASNVVTFVAAGNDATTRPSYPAAFAVDARFRGTDTSGRAVLPLVSVAAENPDGSIALFSNDGAWVTAQAAGANVVSTLPRGFAGAWQAAVSLVGPRDRERRRATIDPDGYRGAFGLWSGTSFAAPALAGQYLTALAGRAGQAALVTVGDSDRLDLVQDLLRPEALGRA